MLLGGGWRGAGGGGVTAPSAPALLAGWWLTRRRRRHGLLLRRLRRVQRILGTGGGPKREGEKHNSRPRQTPGHETVSHVFLLPASRDTIDADRVGPRLSPETATAWRRPQASRTPRQGQPRSYRRARRNQRR